MVGRGSDGEAYKTIAAEFQRAPWLRIEQRGSVALLKAIPA